SALRFFPSSPPSTSAIYTLSLHDALPICLFGCGLQMLSQGHPVGLLGVLSREARVVGQRRREGLFLRVRSCSCASISFRLIPKRDRKSTRLNSSHVAISYAVFCLKKKKKE